MKVATKVMAFTDLLSTAPDVKTGHHDIVAFRACAVEKDYNIIQSDPGKI